MGFDEAMRFLNGPTLIGFLIIFVMLGGYLGWYVMGPAHNREVNFHKNRADREEQNAKDWQAIATQQMEANKALAANQEVQIAMIQAFMARNGRAKSD